MYFKEFIGYLEDKLNKLSYAEVKMVFKCKDNEEVEPVEVSISQDGKDVDILLDGVRVACFKGDESKLVSLYLRCEDMTKLKAKGVELDGDVIAIG
jgi:hypothetical protein